MPPALVYLIPENFHGPVFVFFGQKDGVDMSPDPLGHSALVPKNGVVKIKLRANQVIGHGDKKQNIYWISISKNGNRKKMILNLNSRQDENGKFYDIYYDGNGEPRKYWLSEEKDPFFYFSRMQKKERMIFDHRGCRDQKFMEENDNVHQSPECGKFLVISPENFLKMPVWLWDGMNHHYSSIRELEGNMDEVSIKNRSD